MEQNKTKFTEPEISFVYFGTQDIVATSGGDNFIPDDDEEVVTNLMG